jgi:hypothetical protein
MKKKVFFVWILLLTLASCVIMKKRYMSGYRLFMHPEKKDVPMEVSYLKKHSGNHSKNEWREKSMMASMENNPMPINNDKIPPSDEIKQQEKYHSEGKKNFISFPQKSKVVYKKRINQKKHSPANNSQDPWELTGKSKTVAIVLCVLLGTLGIHRFYLGYTGMGCLYLATCGLFFVGCGIDLVRLISEDLKPKIPEQLESKMQNEIKSNNHLAGSPIVKNIVAEPQVIIKDAKNGFLELNLIYPANFKSRGLMTPFNIGYAKDDVNDPYYQKIPAYDSIKAHEALMERCKSLGYKNYRRFSGFRKECSERLSGSSGFCMNYKAIIECQCTN